MPAGDQGGPLAVVLLSGGMDSAVAAAMVGRDHRLAALHVTYGQRTSERERVCFGALAQHLGIVDKLLVSFDHLARIGGSALTDRRIEVPGAPGLPEHEPGAGAVPVTYVPFRNAHLLATAVSWAEVLGAEAVVIGAVEEDSSGYPDCRRVFYEAFAEVIEQGTRPETRVRVLTPVIDRSKADIVRLGVTLGVPFNLTWSCYRSESTACGTCESCRLRLSGFARAGVEDPLTYARAAPATGTGGPAGDGSGAPPAADRSDRGATGAGSAGPAVTRARVDRSRRENSLVEPDLRARVTRRLEKFLSRVRRS